MYVHQTDLLQGMDRDFIKDLIEISERKNYDKGDFISVRGNKAIYFYIMLKGHVRLITGITGHVIHVINHAGEAFGWASLVGRNCYSTSAECVEPTKLLRIEGKKALNVLEKHPLSGMIVFKRLAKVLGDRLIQGYEAMPGIPQTDASISYGSRQVMDMPAPF